jgi:hypothetical protein
MRLLHHALQFFHNFVSSLATRSTDPSMHSSNHGAVPGMKTNLHRIDTAHMLFQGAFTSICLFADAFAYITFLANLLANPIAVLKNQRFSFFRQPMYLR